MHAFPQLTLGFVIVKVYGNSTIALDAGSNDNQTICNNTVIPNISYTIDNALDANIVGLPTGFFGNFQAPSNFVISGNVNVAG